MKQRPWKPPESVEEALHLQAELRKEIRDIKAELSTAITSAANHKEWERKAALALNVKRHHLDRVNKYLEKHQPQSVHRATAARAVRRMVSEIAQDIPGRPTGTSPRRSRCSASWCGPSRRPHMASSAP